jgi:hypothetical protein
VFGVCKPSSENLSVGGRRKAEGPVVGTSERVKSHTSKKKKEYRVIQKEVYTLKI